MYCDSSKFWNSGRVLSSIIAYIYAEPWALENFDDRGIVFTGSDSISHEYRDFQNFENLNSRLQAILPVCEHFQFVIVSGLVLETQFRFLEILETPWIFTRREISRIRISPDILILLLFKQTFYPRNPIRNLENSNTLSDNRYLLAIPKISTKPYTYTYPKISRSLKNNIPGWETEEGQRREASAASRRR